MKIEDGVITFPDDGTGIFTLPGGTAVEIPSGTLVNENTGILTILPGEDAVVTTPNGTSVWVTGSIKFELDGSVTLLRGLNDARATVETADFTEIILANGNIFEESDNFWVRAQGAEIEAAAEEKFMFIEVGTGGADINYDKTPSGPPRAEYRDLIKVDRVDGHITVIPFNEEEDKPSGGSSGCDATGYALAALVILGMAKVRKRV